MTTSPDAEELFHERVEALNRATKEFVEMKEREDFYGWKMTYTDARHRFPAVPKILRLGPMGALFYINSNGRKVYLKKSQLRQCVSNGHLAGEVEPQPLCQTLSWYTQKETPKEKRRYGALTFDVNMPDKRRALREGFEETPRRLSPASLKDAKLQHAISIFKRQAAINQARELAQKPKLRYGTSPPMTGLKR